MKTSEVKKKAKEKNKPKLVTPPNKRVNISGAFFKGNSTT